MNINFFSDSSEWRYLFRHAIDWNTLIPLYKSSFPTSEGFSDQEELISFYEDLLKTTGEWTGKTLAPRARELDRAGSGKLIDGQVEISDVLKKTYEEAKGMELFKVGMDPSRGGLGVPSLVTLLIVQQVCRACFSSAVQLGFFSSIADMIERFCDSDIKDKYLPLIMKGEVSGSMCLTEPDAGSDVGSLRTSAEKQSDGTYLLNGTKTFISNGGGGLGFVLARIKGAPKGLSGISLFIVEQYLDDSGTGERKQNFRIGRIEEKLGLRGSPTCEVVYENSRGRLVGKENEGFKLMLHLMNESRIVVGLQSLGGMEASLFAARQYAETRQQFGRPIAELPLMKRNLQDWETERDALRALLVDTIFHYDVFQRLDLKKRREEELTEKEAELFARSTRIVRKRTPLVKYYGAETNTTLTQRAIQVFGGYGFMTDSDVERLHRDSFASLLYEGTSQVQALMAMKDFVKTILSDPGNFIHSLVASHPLGALMAGSGYERSYRGVFFEFRKQVAGLLIRYYKPEFSLTEKDFRETLAQINQVFKKEYWHEAGISEQLMAHAETMCQALSYCETLKVLSGHASRDEARGDLYFRYHKLVMPRLAAIYMDWKS